MSPKSGVCRWHLEVLVQGFLQKTSDTGVTAQRRFTVSTRVALTLFECSLSPKERTLCPECP